MREFEQWMRLALTQAAQCEASDDVPVGAVVVDPEGTIIGAGFNEREAKHDPTAHAEITALRQAAAATKNWRLENCTLVVTLEPCVMCAGAISSARISRLVFGAWEPKTGAVGSLYDVLRDGVLNHTVEVYGGILEEESQHMLQAFFAQRRRNS